jgi:hypothetical protein
MMTRTQALDKHFGRRRWRKWLETSTATPEQVKDGARRALDMASRSPYLQPFGQIDIGIDGKVHMRDLREVIDFFDLGYLVPVWKEMKND